MIRFICPLFKKKNCYIDFVYTIICKYRTISTKLEQNVYVQQNLNEFDHGSNWTGTTGVIALELGKIAAFNFVYTLASTNINQ